MKIIENLLFQLCACVSLAAAFWYIFSREIALASLASALIILLIGKFSSDDSWANLFLSRFFFPAVFASLIIISYKFFDSVIGVYAIQLDLFQSSTPFAAFIQIVSTLYAVSIAFLLLKGIQDHEKLGELIRGTSNNSRSISDYLYYFDDNNSFSSDSKLLLIVSSKTGKIRQTIQEYLRELISVAREEFSTSGVQRLVEVQRRMRESISQLNCEDKNDEYALQEIIRNSDALSTKLGQIVTNLKSKMSGVLIAFILIITNVIILSFFDGKFVITAPKTVVIFAMSYLLYFLFMMIVDMNDPFRGKWRIDISTLEDAIQYVSGKKTAADE